MPDLIITPNRQFSSSGIPQIDFIGVSGSGISMQVLEDGSLAYMGTQGQLFGIVDSLTGSLFSVNDIAGLPVIEAFSDDRVVMGTFNSNALVVSGRQVGVGTGSPMVTLHSTGTIRIENGGLQLGTHTTTGGGIAFTDVMLSRVSASELRMTFGSVQGGFVNLVNGANVAYNSLQNSVRSWALRNEAAGTFTIRDDTVGVAVLTLDTSRNAVFASGLRFGDTGNYTHSGATSIAQTLALSGFITNLIQVSAAGVSSLNDISGAVNVVGGTGSIVVSFSGQNILINGGGGAIPSTLVYTTGAQDIAGPKTFNSGLFVSGGASITGSAGNIYLNATGGNYIYIVASGADRVRIGKGPGTAGALEFARIGGGFTSQIRGTDLAQTAGGLFFGYDGGGTSHMALENGQIRMDQPVIFGNSSTPNSNNGRIQLSTHTASGNGIGFGPDTSLWTTAANQLVTNATVTLTGLVFPGGSRISGDGTTLTLNASTISGPPASTFVLQSAVGQNLQLNPGAGGNIYLNAGSFYIVDNGSTIARPAANVVSVNTASLEAVRWDASQNAIHRSGIFFRDTGNYTRSGTASVAQLYALSGALGNQGVTLAPSILYQTGTQTVSGQKTFLGNTHIANLITTGVISGFVLNKYINLDAGVAVYGDSAGAAKRVARLADCSLYNFSENLQVDWNAGQLYAGGAMTLDWANYALTYHDGSNYNNTVDWFKRSLSGSWTTDGTLSAKNYNYTISGVATPVVLGALPTNSGRMNLDMSAAGLVTATITGGTIISGINYVAGSAVTLRVFSQTNSAQLAFPTGWRFLNSSMPTGLPWAKAGLLTVQCFTAHDTGICAAWALQG